MLKCSTICKTLRDYKLRDTVYPAPVGFHVLLSDITYFSFCNFIIPPCYPRLVTEVAEGEQ